jgi:hypothetical protein
MDVKRSEVDGEHKHHLHAPDLQDLSAAERAALSRLPCDAVNFERVSPFYQQEPLLLLIVEVYDGVLARDQLTRTEINVDKVFLAFGFWFGPRRLGRPANVDPQACDIVCPILGRNLGICLYAVLV